MRTLKYTLKRGEVWERLVIIKDRRTRRKRVPVEAAAAMRIPDLGDFYIPSLITSEGGVLLTMTPNNTEWLEDGTYEFDIVATVSRSALLTSTPLMETVVTKGTITVSSYDNITPMRIDSGPLEPLEQVPVDDVSDDDV
jgi:hypothetical protein